MRYKVKANSLDIAMTFKTLASSKCGPIGKLRHVLAIFSVIGKCPILKPAAKYAFCKCGGMG
jgi:hypothetical protein